MRTSKPVNANGKKLKSYQQSQIMHLDPTQLLIRVYDYTIVHCKRRDMGKACKGLVELISALNFDYEEMSLGLFRLYQYCMDKIKQSDYDAAIEILQELRDSWSQSNDDRKKGEKQASITA